MPDEDARQIGAGRRCNATSRKSGNIASRPTRHAGDASAKRSCTGHMTVEEFRGPSSRWSLVDPIEWWKSHSGAAGLGRPPASSAPQSRRRDLTGPQDPISVRSLDRPRTSSSAAHRWNGWVLASALASLQPQPVPPPYHRKRLWAWSAHIASFGAVGAFRHHPRPGWEHLTRHVIWHDLELRRCHWRACHGSVQKNVDHLAAREHQRTGPLY